MNCPESHFRVRFMCSFLLGEWGGREIPAGCISTRINQRAISPLVSEAWAGFPDHQSP